MVMITDRSQIHRRLLYVEAEVAGITSLNKKEAAETKETMSCTITTTTKHIA